MLKPCLMTKSIGREIDYPLPPDVNAMDSTSIDINQTLVPINLFLSLMPQGLASTEQ